MDRDAKPIVLPKLTAVVVGLLAAVGPWVVAVDGIDGPSVAFAHPVLTTYIHHRERIDVGRTNIDVEVELTFYELRSLIERRRMDADHDEVITPAEIKDYLARIADSLENGLRMTLSGRAVELAPLYDPEIDLLGVDRISPQHHILRLFYFARTPAWLEPGSEIRLEDSLWSGVPSLGACEVIGSDGIRVVSDPSTDAVVSAPVQRRVAAARVVAVPPHAGSGEKGDRYILPGRPEGCFAQNVPVPFLSHSKRFLFIGIILIVICGVAVRLHTPKREKSHASRKTI